MGKGSFWVIDGVKVKKKNPFTFEIIPHQDPPQKDPTEKQPPHPNPMNTMTNQQMARTFFADNIEQLPNQKIDYATFRNSASSLRDFYLFGPPPVVSQASTLDYYYINEEQYPGISTVKRNIFLNEFVTFCYKQSG